MVPSIYTIDPTEGLASGRALMTLTGWGYRVPDPPDGFPGDDVTPSCAVYVGGRAADAVAVLSSTEIQIVIPAYLGDPTVMDTPVDVLVKNLDDDGDPISGEEYTLAAAFTYKRPDLTEEAPTEWITREVMDMLDRNVLANVVVSTSPDYSSNPSTQLTETAGLPVVILEGPRIRENKQLRHNVPRVGTSGSHSGKTRKKPPFTADLLYDIMVVGRDKFESQNLKDAASGYFNRRPIFVFHAGPSDSTEVECNLYVEGAEWTPTDNDADQTFAYSNTIRLEGIQFDDLYGLADQGVPAPGQFFTDTYEEDELTTEEIG